MTQNLKVDLTIQIPSDLVLITKVELQQLKENELKGVYWTMKDLEKHVNRNNDWIKERILYPSHFRRILDIEYGGFVFYPEAKGQLWAFQASKMADFLDQHFGQIFKGN